MDKLVELLSVEDYKKAIENKSIIVFQLHGVLIVIS